MRTFWGITYKLYVPSIRRYDEKAHLYSTQKELLEDAKKRGWTVRRKGSSNVYIRINPSTGKEAYVKGGKLVVPDYLKNALIDPHRRRH